MAQTANSSGAHDLPLPDLNVTHNRVTTLLLGPCTMPIITELATGRLACVSALLATMELPVSSGSVPGRLEIFTTVIELTNTVTAHLTIARSILNSNTCPIT